MEKGTRNLTKHIWCFYFYKLCFVYIISLSTISISFAKEKGQALSPEDTFLNKAKTLTYKAVEKANTSFLNKNTTDISVRLKVKNKTIIDNYKYIKIKERNPIKSGEWKSSRPDSLSFDKKTPHLPVIIPSIEDNKITKLPKIHNKNKQIFISQKIVNLYKQILGKYPDKISATYWSKKLKQGMSLLEIRRDLANSAENITIINKALANNPNLHSEIVDIYKKYLKRYPDKGGLIYWSNKLNGEMSLKAVTESIATSKEAKMLENYK